MSKRPDHEHLRVGRPAKYDPLELAAFSCNGVNRGKTATEIATDAAELMAKLKGLKRTRQVASEIKQAVPNLVKAFQRSRETLLQPWNPEIGKGIHQLEKSTRVVAFGELIFMGRPLPRPIGIEPREAIKRGRPKKSRS